ncbi:hypothetical protein ABEB36_007239 [Hypothenemus hampei]|uniref:Uncharacterized protein n=1 Tax=Hypothenemus hampei TaxID=57062 RepID=A0ABD1EU67_HYPHA
MVLKLLWVLIWFHMITGTFSLSCLETKKSYEEKCLQTDRQNYIKCIQTRMKRHQRDCEYSQECYECDCDSCSYSQCEGRCDDCCNSCCSRYIQCRTNHCCHKQCHSECRSYSCRNNCRKSCYETVQQEFGEPRRSKEKVTNVLDTEQKIGVNNTNVHNTSIVINLKNVLNNTQVLDVPINVTYLNKNNITLEDTGSTNSRDDCCIVVGPRQCSRMGSQVRCIRTRARQCGSICTDDSGPIEHVEPQDLCTSPDGQPINCDQSNALAFRPQRKCTYTNVWPYVDCRLQLPSECDVCYGNQFNLQMPQYNSCPPRCKDIFTQESQFRQGPFFQPSYNPEIPPCMYSPQGCGQGYMGRNIMGGFYPEYNAGIPPGFGASFPFSPARYPFGAFSPLQFNNTDSNGIPSSSTPRLMESDIQNVDGNTYKKRHVEEKKRNRDKISVVTVV